MKIVIAVTIGVVVLIVGVVGLVAVLGPGGVQLRRRRHRRTA